jgi:hypothetical protein
MVDTMDQASDVLVTGEPRETETLTRGSERGRWKSTPQGNSLAAYSTARAVLRGRGPGDRLLLPDRPLLRRSRSRQRLSHRVSPGQDDET